MLSNLISMLTGGVATVNTVIILIYTYTCTYIMNRLTFPSSPLLPQDCFPQRWVNWSVGHGKKTSIFSPLHGHDVGALSLVTLVCQLPGHSWWSRHVVSVVWLYCVPCELTEDYNTRAWFWFLTRAEASGFCVCVCWCAGNQGLCCWWRTLLSDTDHWVLLLVVHSSDKYELWGFATGNSLPPNMNHRAFL